ncbi:MAG: sensor histidine kinase [Propionibacteriaceae bacterium]|nr:sensor histidine kinase [Propionibacteriaceae bacterium]
MRDWPTTLVPLILLAASVAGAVLLTAIVPQAYAPSTAWFFVPLALLLGGGRWLLGGLPRQSGAARVTFWATTAVTVPLVLLNPVFGLVAFFGYVDSARQLKGIEALAGLGATAVVCAIAQTGGVSSPLFTPWVLALFFLINVAIAGSMARLDKARQDRADGLERINAELVESQRRNEALQAELVAQARDTGVAEERARLAREIHDTVAQDLVGIIAQLGAVSGLDDLAERERRLAVVDETARKALAEVRRSVQALSSPRLDEADLPAALADLLTGWRGDGGHARLIVDGDPRPSANDPVILRIAQEALSNARRHANAANVQVELGYEPGHVRVTIADDGAGFSPATAPHGVGLPGMRGRAEEADGELTVDSEPGRGTIITATLPGRWR